MFFIFEAVLQKQKAGFIADLKPHSTFFSLFWITAPAGVSVLQNGGLYWWCGEDIIVFLTQDKNRLFVCSWSAGMHYQAVPSLYTLRSVMLDEESECSPLQIVECTFDKQLRKRSFWKIVCTVVHKSTFAYPLSIMSACHLKSWYLTKVNCPVNVNVLISMVGHFYLVTQVHWKSYWNTLQSVQRVAYR